MRHQGVTVYGWTVARDLVGQPVRCLPCGRAFRLPRGTFGVVADGEVLGYLGVCCLSTGQRQRLTAKLRELEPPTPERRRQAGSRLITLDDLEDETFAEAVPELWNGAPAEERVG